MSRLSAFKNIVILSACTTFVFTSCGDNEVDDCKLPDGKYPITFATAVEGLTVSRAATADGFWTEGDRVAVKVESNVMEYAVTNTNSSNPAMLKIVEAKNSLYWQTPNDEKIVSAWYCGTGYNATLPKSWSVESDQSIASDNGYQRSDFLYAPSMNITFNKRTTPLKFYHQTARIVINIKKPTSINDNDVIQSVVIGNKNNIALSGAYSAPLSPKGAAGTWDTKSSRSKMGTITAKDITVSGGNYLKTYTALVIPQNMSEMKFIVITLDDGSTFYYTPKRGEANLETGKQYTYNIAIKKTGLEVEVESNTSWTDEKASSSKIENAIFRITLSGNSLPTFTKLEGIEKTANPNVYETTGGKTFSISYNIPASDNKKNFIILKGLANAERIVMKNDMTNDITYTFTYNNLRSDLWLNYDEYPAVGDYYYADGTWSPDYISLEDSPACIGIIFKVDKGDYDDVENYEGKLTAIHGYVVALHDAHNEAGLWGIRYTQSIPWAIGQNYVYKYDGYSNTNVVRDTPEYVQTKINQPHAFGQYWAFKVASEYNICVPNNSSGWYLPSVGQLNDIYNIPNRAKLFENAGGIDFKERYWSSTEVNSLDVWIFLFNSGIYGKQLKYDGSPWMGNDVYSYVRSILTF